MYPQMLSVICHKSNSHCQSLIQLLYLGRDFSELDKRQLFSFATTSTPQRNNVMEPQGPTKIQQILSSRCLHEVGTTNLLK